LVRHNKGLIQFASDNSRAVTDLFQLCFTAATFPLLSFLSL